MYKLRLAAWSVRKNQKRRPGRVQVEKREILDAEDTLDKAPSSQKLRRSANPVPLQDFRLAYFLSWDSNPPSRLTHSDGIYDNILGLTRHYIDSRLSSTDWRCTDYVMGERGEIITEAFSKSFGGHIMAANHLFAMGEYSAAELELVNSSGCIDKLLKSEDPDLLCILLRLIYVSQGIYWAFQKILEQIASLAEIILGVFHPLSQISRFLSSLKPAEYNSIITMFFEATIDTFVNQLGQTHQFVLIYRLEYLKIFAKLPYTSNIARKLMQECELALDTLDNRFIRVQLGLGWNYHDQDCLLEAREIAQDILRKAEYCSSVEKAWNRRHAYKLLAYSHKGLGSTREAEASYQKHIFHIVLQDGERSGNHVRSLVIFERWYVEWGLIEEALAVKEKRATLQLSMKILV